MCKKFIYLFLFVAFAFSTTAMASEIAISTQANWWPQAAADAEMQEIVDNVTDVSVERFTASQQAALAAWVTAHTGNGSSDLLILCGQFPDTIYGQGNTQPDGSIAELFLDAGNVIINTGDWIFYVVNSTGDNGPAGLQNMMDIPGVTVAGEDNTAVTVTADGTNYTPTLANFATDRPFHLDTLAGDWVTELVLAQSPANSNRADPVIVHNTVTDGRIGIFHQIADELTGVRGEVISEWINNWYLVYVADTTKARSPDPSHGAIDVPVDANLGWARGTGAQGDNVYFGTDPCNLPLITQILSFFPPLYEIPGDLIPSTTYYWRIDEVNGPVIVTGDLWEFTTVRGEATITYPLDGSIILGDPYPFPPAAPTHIYTTLVFEAGPTAVKHVGYFSENFADVFNRIQDANMGPPPYPGTPGYETTYYAGMPLIQPMIDSLVRGTRYYWCVDETDALGNEFGGNIWSFDIQSFYAYEPDPPNEAIFIPTDVLLSWQTGAGATEHDIYMGTDWEDVNNAVYSFSPPFAPEFMTTRVDPNYQTSGLAAETKIYWRIDEVQGRLPPVSYGTVYKGQVWEFETVPFFPIVDPNLVGWWKLDLGAPTTAFDSSGHNNHGTLMGDPQWVVGGMIDGAMEFDGEDDYVDFGIPVGWPSGLSGRSLCGWGKTNTLAGGWRWIAAYGSPATGQAMFIGMNGDDLYGGGYGDDILLNDFWEIGVWHHISVTYDGTTAKLYADAEEVASMAKTWNLVLNRAHLGRQVNDAIEFWDGQIDDVQIYDYALSAAEIRMLGAPPEAWLPSPYDGETGVPTTVTLQWMPGKYADKHDVYYGTDKTAVESATTLTPGIYKGRYDPNTFGPVLLNAAELYYWRIDEVNSLGPAPGFWKGNTWIFRTVGAAGGLLGLYYHWDGLLPNDPLGPDNAFQIFVLSRIEPEINWNWGAGSPDPNVNVEDFGCRWVGHVEAPVDANYTFYTTTDDGARLFIDGVKMPLVNPLAPANDSWRQQGMTEYGASVVLTAGLHDIEMHMYERAGGAGAELRWSAIPTNPLDDAISKRIIPPIWLWPPLFASGPRPPDGSTIDDRMPALEWIAGVNADFHELYFSANYDDVNNRNSAVKHLLADPCYPYPAVPLLELGRTYYWLVDEVKSIPAGRWDARTVWSFTISECLSIENVEDYNDRGELRRVWRDGSANVVWGGTYPFLFLAQGGSSGSNLNVSTAVGGFGPGGAGPQRGIPLNDEAMVLRYDNDGFTYVGLPGEEEWVYDAPYYSEIEANTIGTNGLGVGQTWDSEGVKSFTMWFQGHPISDGFHDTSAWPAFTLHGRGRDLWGRHDEFYYFSNYPLTGSGLIHAEVVRMDNTALWAKAGVMIREKMTPYSRHAAVYITPGQGVTFNYRETEDGPTLDVTKPGVTAPQYVKLERTITGVFQASHSDDGSNWHDVNAPGASPVYPTISMGTISDPNIYVGTAVSSVNGSEVCSADFNNVFLSPWPTGWGIGNIGTNAAEQLYVALSDGTNTAVVEHNDVNAATLTTWQEWNIDLSDFTGINLDGIKKVYIGLGDRDVPAQGGSGAIYVDDIRACPPRCVATLLKPLYDIAQPYDCIVNELDLVLVGADWLIRDELITTVAPNPANLLASYQFEGNYFDTSGQLNHLTDPCSSNPGFDTGMIGAQALSLDGVDDYLVTGVNDIGIEGNTPRTITCWAKADHTNITDWTLIFGFTNINGVTNGHFNIGSLGGPGGVGGHVWGWEETIFTDEESLDWHHYAMSYDGTTITYYGDGIEMDTDVGKSNVRNLITEDRVHVGKRATSDLYFPGDVDDARIYGVQLTKEEIAYIYTGGAPSLHIQIPSVADVYQGEPQGSQFINFNDYSLIASKYLEEVLWPAP